MSANMYTNATGHGQPYPAVNDLQANAVPIPWEEIFSRHESVLSTHLEMLDSVKGHVAQDGEAFRVVSSMVNKTIQTMNQFKVVRKQMLTRKPPANPFHFASSSASKMNARQTPTSQSTDTDPTSRRKRSRTEKERDITSTESETNTQSDIFEDRASKRKRDLASHPAAEDFPHASGSLETEDISEEVQRRLRIKEERLRRKDDAKPEKRKRESLLSNESSSPGNFKHRRKRARTGHDSKRDSEMTTEANADLKIRKQRKSRH